ncbi:MAG: acyl-CoA thioesterase II [Acidimicrobiales bacterium]
MTDALDTLVRILDLEPIEVNMFRGTSPQEQRQRIFGGQVAGQALVAAGRTVEPDRSVHSLHAYFLRPGDPTVPVLYEVDRIRDGRSFTTRRVVAIQHGRAIFNLSASFHIHEPDGMAHQSTMPEVADPEGLPTFKERMAPWAERMGDWYHRPKPIDLRFVDSPVQAQEAGRGPEQRVWFRADGRLPDDILLHACVVAYASDMTLLDTVMIPHRITFDDANMIGASLDHAMWFHRPFRADEWLLYDQESPSASSSLGLSRGKIYARDGRLVVSVVQEGLLRLINSDAAQTQ